MHAPDRHDRGFGGDRKSFPYVVMNSPGWGRVPVVGGGLFLEP